MDALRSPTPYGVSLSRFWPFSSPGNIAFGTFRPHNDPIGAVHWSSLNLIPVVPDYKGFMILTFTVHYFFALCGADAGWASASAAYDNCEIKSITKMSLYWNCFIGKCSWAIGRGRQEWLPHHSYHSPANILDGVLVFLLPCLRNKNISRLKLWSACWRLCLSEGSASFLRQLLWCALPVDVASAGYSFRRLMKMMASVKRCVKRESLWLGRRRRRRNRSVSQSHSSASVRLNVFLEK